MKTLVSAGSWLRVLEGRRLTRVVRWLFESDSDRTDFEQDADGPTSLYFEPSLLIHIQPDTEKCGLKVSDADPSGFGPGYVARDVSRNRFWAQRTGARVIHVEILKSVHATQDLPSEFGLEVHFHQGLTAGLEYIDTEEWPDTLRVRAKLDDASAERIVLF